MQPTKRGSTGVPNIDWLLGDAVVMPSGDGALRNEQVPCLPGPVFCFAPEVPYPQPGWDTSASCSAC